MILGIILTEKYDDKKIDWYNIYQFWKQIYTKKTPYISIRKFIWTKN